MELYSDGISYECFFKGYSVNGMMFAASYKAGDEHFRCVYMHHLSHLHHSLLSSSKSREKVARKKYKEFRDVLLKLGFCHTYGCKWTIYYTASALAWLIHRACSCLYNTLLLQTVSSLLLLFHTPKAAFVLRWARLGVLELLYEVSSSLLVWLGNNNDEQWIYEARQIRDWA